MTTFVLVSGPFTGGWMWDEVTARLHGAGAEVHPVTLTGMGGDSRPAGPGTDLETHVEDVVRLIDGVEAPEVVVVGHGYGIHPVLGAADRRPERVARIVHLDGGMPSDGESALALVPDATLRDRLSDQGGQDWRVPAPSVDEWQHWGSTAGVPAEALARLDREAVSQPSATLTQPLRLSGAVSALPTTGVFCTGNGLSIAMVQALVASGQPRFQRLADPRVSFFELDTGHWPMLSAPGELAAVLLRAAAGEGHRLTATGGEPPTFLRPFLIDVPERDRERTGRVDLYFPDTDQPRPAVVLVHGGPFPAALRPTPRDWPAYAGYGRYAASLGVVGVVLDHRLHGLADYGRAAEDVAAAVELARADPRVDGERVALWYFSGAGLLSAEPLAAPPEWLKCVGMNYPVLAPLPDWAGVEPRFRPASAVAGAGRLPIVLTRVELEEPEIAVTIEEFLTAAEACGTGVEVIDVPQGHHGFETIDHTVEARHVVEHAMRSVLGHLRG